MDMDTTTDTAPQLRKQNTKEKIFKILNLSVPVLMGIFIFFNPFPHTTAIKEICFYGSVIIALILICFKKIDFSFKSPLTLPFALFVIWAFIGLFFALDKGNSIHDFRAYLLEYLAIYYILVNFFNSRKRLIILSWIIIISASIFSIGGIICFYKLSGHPISGRMGFAGIAAINNIGFITVPAMLLSLNLSIKEKKVLNKMILLICMLGTLFASLLTQTVAIFLAILFPLLILFIKNKKGVVVFSLFLILILGFMPIKNRLTFKAIQTHLRSDDRICIWHTYLGIIKDHPITGVGFGMRIYVDKLTDKYAQYKATAPPKYRPGQFHTPHNMLIDITVRLGFIGLALFLYIISMFIYVGYKMIKYGRDNFIRKWVLCLLAVMVAFLIQGFFADILFGGYLIILYTILAMMTILWRINSEPDPQILQN